MPYKDHEQKLEAQRRWRREVMPKGYGRWLYARRKLRFDDAERFHKAIEEAIEALFEVMASDDLNSALKRAGDALETLQSALRESMEAEEALGKFKEGGR